MAFSPLTLSPEILQEVLKRFKGCPIDVNEVTSYQKSAVHVFDNPVYILDPRIHATCQIDISEIYKNYEQHYKPTPGATFTTFIKWLIIKSQTRTPFLWRKLNNQWYEFYNLPMEVTMRTSQRRELALYLLENVSMSTWEVFCKKHLDYKAGMLKDILWVDVGLPIHWLAYQMINVHLPRMTSYYTTTRAFYAHQPWFVISDRYELNGSLYLPFYLNYSHVTLTPEDAEMLINQFQTFAKMKPFEVEQHCIKLVKAHPPIDVDNTKMPSGPGSGDDKLFL